MPTDHEYNREAMWAYDLDEPSGDPLDDGPIYSSQEQQYEARMKSCLSVLSHSKRSPEEVCKMYMVDVADLNYFRPIFEARLAALRIRWDREAAEYNSKYGNRPGPLAQ